MVWWHHLSSPAAAAKSVRGALLSVELPANQGRVLPAFPRFSSLQGTLHKPTWVCFGEILGVIKNVLVSHFNGSCLIRHLLPGSHEPLPAMDVVHFLCCNPGLGFIIRRDGDSILPAYCSKEVKRPETTVQTWQVKKYQEKLPIVNIEFYLFHLQPCYCQNSSHPPRPILMDIQTLLDFGPFLHSAQHSTWLGEIKKKKRYICIYIMQILLINFLLRRKVTPRLPLFAPLYRKCVPSLNWKSALCDVTKGKDTSLMTFPS